MATNIPAAQTLRQLNQQKAVMPDGKILSREDILKNLGIDPGIVADKWLTVGCGVNSAAVPDKSIREMISKGNLQKSALDAETIKRIDKMGP